MAVRMIAGDPKEAQKFFANKLGFTTGPMELDYMIKKGEPPTIIDVRAAVDYGKEHIPGAINLPEDQWASLKGLRTDAVNVIYCYNIVCHLAARGAHFFAGRGF